MNLSSEQVLQLKQSGYTQLLQSIQLKERMLENDYLDVLVSMAEIIAKAVAHGGKLMLCGNGGSAADAQHLAAELLVRLRSKTNRSSIPALSLALDPSTMTACSNDYGFECLYERMVEGLGKPGDVLLGITTSGRSKNVIRALEAARHKGILTLGFLGSDGEPAFSQCALALVVPSHDTNRIQETHITLGHILMDFVEQLLLQGNHIVMI